LVFPSFRVTVQRAAVGARGASFVVAPHLAIGVLGERTT
jgi:hypothetical protein